MGIELNNDQIYASYKMENWWHHSTEQLFQISGGPRQRQDIFSTIFDR